MKKTRIVLSALVLAIVIAHSAASCKKKTEEAYECKTCKAFGLDGPVDEEEVCSEAAEAAFRSANPGRQITCQ
jgi:hypothetical protein